jgi:glutathione S-transferase
LEDKGLEIVNAYGKTRTEEFIAMNPCHCCPTLEFGGDKGVMWESCACMRTMCQLFEGGEKYYPKDPILRGKIDLVCDWKNTVFYPCFPSLGYVIFGYPNDTAKAKEDFKKLCDEHFVTLTDTFLKGKKFCYSDTPTIADLGVAPLLTLIKGRPKFWAKVPDAVKDYHTRVLEAFPEADEYFKMLEGMVTGYTGDGRDAEP